MDYTYLYKHSYQRIDEIQNLLPYDIFISSYVNSQRVQEPADNIQAGQKIWFATEEEGRDLYLSGKDVTFVKANEDYAPITEKLDTLQLSGKSVCVDATGCRGPYLMFLMRCMSMYKISLIYYILNPHNIDVLKTLNSLTFLRSKTDAWKVWYPYVKGRQ